MLICFLSLNIQLIQYPRAKVDFGENDVKLIREILVNVTTMYQKLYLIIAKCIASVNKCAYHGDNK